MERLLIRMAMWLRRPPSRSFMIAAAVVVALAALVYTVEQAGYWPDWAKAERVGRHGGGQIKVVPMQ